MKKKYFYVIKTFKKGKSPENDEIIELANKIYNTGYIPKEMHKSIFITIPKKP